MRQINFKFLGLLAFLALSLMVFSCKKKSKSVYFKKSSKTITQNQNNKSNNPKTQNQQKTNENTESSGQQVDKILTFAKAQIGVPYKFGGTDRNGYDCSGLTSQSYNSAGLKIPRTAGDQANQGKTVSINNLSKGDLVFFSNKKGGNNITHVGVVSQVSASSVKFIHASTSRGVVENELLTGYYRDLFVKAVRYVQ
ncbi:MAG: C40 family peptidase [Cytophagales bacterium]